MTEKGGVLVALFLNEVTMLKGISPLISPELLKILAEMGHGDYIVFADANFPSESIGEYSRVVRADGHTVPDLLRAVLPLFPLDTYVAKPVSLMARMCIFRMAIMPLSRSGASLGLG